MDYYKNCSMEKRGVIRNIKGDIARCMIQVKSDSR